MTEDVARIVEGLSEDTRAAVLRIHDTDDYRHLSGRGLSIKGRRRLRYLGFIHPEDAVRGIWKYRLTALGKAVRAHLMKGECDE